jgi:oligoribonuclease NrnB/cAMP/cGMP phosphodiesterase (DHH superfamily)
MRLLASKLIWCDHHKSAKERLITFWTDKKIKGIRDLERCGAMLMYDYFNLSIFNTYPLILEYVDDYDRWVTPRPITVDWFAELNKNWSIKQWLSALNTRKLNMFAGYLQKGEELYNLKLERVDQAIKKGKAIMFKGHKTFLVNNTLTMDGALLGNTIIRNGYDIALKFEIIKDKVIFGLNSIEGLDVSNIAKEFGGGGHKNASGFHIPLSTFNNFLLTETQNIKEEKE